MAHSVKMGDYVIWVQIVSLFMLKLKIFMKTLQKAEKMFGSSNYWLERLLPNEKKKSHWLNER